MKKFKKRNSNRESFKSRMYRFMYGRYGTDELYTFIFILFLLVWAAELIITAFMEEGMAQAIVSICLSAATFALLIWSTFRVFSRNVYKRRRENEVYLKALRGLKRFFGGNISRRSRSGNRDDATSIFRDCTKCGATLRLPRRQGKHSVRCPRCNHSFYIVSK